MPEWKYEILRGAVDWHRPQVLGGRGEECDRGQDGPSCYQPHTGGDTQASTTSQPLHPQYNRYIIFF